MKNKIISAALCVIMCLSVAACTPGTMQNEEELKLTLSGVTDDKQEYESEADNISNLDSSDEMTSEEIKDLEINTDPLPKTVTHWFENALTDVFKNTAKNKDSMDKAEINMAKNESEGMQIAIRSTAKLDDVTVYAEKISGKNAPSVSAMHIERVYNSTPSAGVGGGLNGHGKADYSRGGSPNYFPEYYNAGTAKKDIAKNTSESFLVEATTTASTKPGTYTTNIVINSAQGQRKIPVTITVYDVTIPEAKNSTIAYENWAVLFADTDCIVSMQDATAFGMLDSYYDYTNEENIWKTLENYAKVMKKQRQNTVLVPLYSLLLQGMEVKSDGTYKMDFTYFDKFIETFMKYGSIKYFSGTHAYGDDWYTHHAPTEPNTWPTGDLVAPVYVNKDGRVTQEWKLVDENKAEVEKHIDSFFGQLFDHLEEKGWDKMWIQHVIDEPKSEIQTKQATALYKKFKQMCPSIELVDAGSGQNKRFGDELSIPCPQLDSYHYNQADFDKKNADGYYAELWTYTCVGPQGNWMTRIGDYPLLSTRVIGWYLQQNKLDGYLHWAWNLWTHSKKGGPYKDMSCSDAPTDGWLVYPDGVNYSVKEGPRATAVRDGFEDYEIILLASKKDAKKTEELLDSKVTNALAFERDEAKFLEARQQFLEIAAGK